MTCGQTAHACGALLDAHLGRRGGAAPARRYVAVGILAVGVG